MLRLPWFTFKQEKGKDVPLETFGTMAISDRFEDRKPRLIIRDPEGNVSVLTTETIKEGEGENLTISVQTSFQPSK